MHDEFSCCRGLKKIVFPLGKDWMPSNMVSDCIDFFIFTEIPG